MTTTNPMMTTTDAMTAGSADDSTGTTMVVPDGTSSEGSASDDAMATSSSDDGMVSSSSDGGMTESSSTTDPTDPSTTTDPTDPSTTTDPTDPSTSTTDPTDPSTTTDPTIDPSTSTGDPTDPSTTSDPTIDPSTSTGDPTDPSTTTDPTDPTATTSTGTDTGDDCIEIACGGQVYECGDCVDNDGDGPIDGIDVECISPCDDDESTFATGIPGDNIDLCHQDCFFDGNSGAGDDGCEWFLACDPLDPDLGECSVPGGQKCEFTQTQECIDNCQVPNGCDCFGCCTVTVDGVPINILVGAEGCSLENLAACPMCTQVPDCTDPCDPTDCELCFGETELPPGCKEPTCPDGQDPCEVATDCPINFFCQTGCCEQIPK